MTNSIQSREYSKDGGSDGYMHIIDSDGNPKVFNVKRNDDGKRWLNTNYANPDNHWNLDNEIVFRSRKLFYFSALSGVCFISCPLQPPSIFPTSSTLVERKIYFLLSNDLVSQRIIKNTLAVSIFLKSIANKRQFFSRRQKTGSNHKFKRFYKKRINSLTQGETMRFWYDLIVLKPDKIKIFGFLNYRRYV